MGGAMGGTMGGAMGRAMGGAVGEAVGRDIMLCSDSIRAGISVYSHTHTHTHTHTTHIAFCSWHAVLFMLGAIKLHA